MMNLLSMKQGSLFCLSCQDLPNHGASCHTLGIFKKLSMSRGASNWFETLWSYSVEGTDYWTIFFMKIKQNQNWKLHWNLGAFLVLLENLQQVRCNRLYFTTFRANKMWEILIFEWILLLEIQTNCKTLGLEGKVSWALNVFTLGPMAQDTVVGINFSWGLWSVDKSWHTRHKRNWMNKRCVILGRCHLH